MKQRRFGGLLRAIGGESLSGEFYLFLRVHTMFLVFSRLPIVFLNTLLIGQSQNMNVVLGYNAVAFVSCASCMLLASRAVHRLGPGLTAVLGIAGYNIFYLFLVLMGGQATHWSVLLGMLVGLADGFYWLCYGCLLSGTTQAFNRDSGLAIISICGSLVNLVVPLLSGAVISFVGGLKGYGVVFGVALAVALFTAILALRLPPSLRQPSRQKTDYAFALRLVLRNKGMRYAYLAQSCKGIREGAFLFAMGVVLYQLVSNELLIGFNTFLSALAAMASFVVISRVVTVARRVPLMVMAVVVLAVSAGLCLLFLGPLAVLVFSFINSSFGGFIENSCFTTLLDYLQTVPGASDHRPELLAMNECALATGRIVGLGIVVGITYFAGQAVVYQMLGLLALILTQFGTAALCRKALPQDMME